MREIPQDELTTLAQFLDDFNHHIFDIRYDDLILSSHEDVHTWLKKKMFFDEEMGEAGHIFLTTIQFKDSYSGSVGSN